MTAFTQALDLRLPKGSGQSGGPVPDESPGPAPCSYCDLPAYIIGQPLACTKRTERWCVRHFVAHAKKHSKCRTCFREAVIVHD